jgi:hypothetical protein
MKVENDTQTTQYAHYTINTSMGWHLCHTIHKTWFNIEGVNSGCTKGSHKQAMAI